MKLNSTAHPGLFFILLTNPHAPPHKQGATLPFVSWRGLGTIVLKQWEDKIVWFSAEGGKILSDP